MPDRKEGCGRNGSVLMETVLVLPLLLVLLGGVMWLGQIQLNRIRLIEADRYVTWQRANRHLGGSGGRTPTTDELRPFGFASEVGEDLSFISALQTAGTPATFWRGVAGGVEMQLQAPSWIAGLLRSVELMDASSAPDPNAWQIAELRGRPVMRDADAADTAAPNSYEGHFVLAVSPLGADKSRYVGDRYKLGELGNAVKAPDDPDPILEMDWDAVASEITFQ